MVKFLKVWAARESFKKDNYKPRFNMCKKGQTAFEIKLGFEPL